MRDACTTYSGISRRYENRIHRCHQQWDDDNTTPRRFTNVTVAADRSSINGAQSSARPTGTRYPCTAFLLLPLLDATQ